MLHLGLTHSLDKVVLLGAAIIFGGPGVRQPLPPKVAYSKVIARSRLTEVLDIHMEVFYNLMFSECAMHMSRNWPRI